MRLIKPAFLTVDAASPVFLISRPGPLKLKYEWPFKYMIEENVYGNALAGVAYPDQVQSIRRKQKLSTSLIARTFNPTGQAPRQHVNM